MAAVSRVQGCAGVASATALAVAWYRPCQLCAACMLSCARPGWRVAGPSKLLMLLLMSTGGSSNNRGVPAACMLQTASPAEP